MTNKTKTRRPSALDATATPAQQAATALAALLTDAPAEADVTKKDVTAAGKAYRKVATAYTTPKERTAAEAAMRASWQALEDVYKVDADGTRETEAQNRYDVLTEKVKTAKADLKSLQAAKVAYEDERRETGLAMRAAGWSQKATARVLGVSDTSVRNWTEAAAKADAPDAPEGDGSGSGSGAPEGTAPSLAEVLTVLDRVEDMISGVDLTPDAHAAIAARLTALVVAVDALAEIQDEADAA